MIARSIFANAVCSLPPCGGGLGRGVAVGRRAASHGRHTTTPTPHPSPQGGGEPSEFAARKRANARRISPLLALALLVALPLAGCGDDKPPTYQGWIEANLIFVGPDEAGRVETLSVREGDKVEVGSPLFTLDGDLHKADLNMTMATLANAKQTFERAQTLARTGAGTQKDFDAAQAALREAEARVNTSQTRLARRSIASPVAGTVQQVYFRPGEVVTASKPIVALLPPGNMKVRFFVPETVLPRITYGETVTVHCDGCSGDLTAKVSFISKTVEFTPPVIYSLEERAKLVFLIEALPVAPANLRVGQPVDVRLDKDAKNLDAKP